MGMAASALLGGNAFAGIQTSSVGESRRRPQAAADFQEQGRGLGRQVDDQGE